MISLTIGLALAVSIAIGRVRKINIGLVAIPVSYTHLTLPTIYSV